MINAVRADGTRYQNCVNQQMMKFSGIDMDSRAATDMILKACEPILADIRERFLEQEVPEAIADRYLKRKRTRMARNVLFEMMRLSAMRENSGNSNPAEVDP